ncbi:MAG: aminoacyl-tRNA deacylase [Nitrospiria bacterium]
MRPMEIKKTVKMKGRWKGVYKGKKQEKKPETSQVLDRLEALFEEKKIPYRVIPHAEVYTAPEWAQSIHAPGREVAKVVIVRTGYCEGDPRYVMAVLPSHRQPDLIRFAMVVGESSVSLATESELKFLFPDCEAGAMPPFERFYGMSVYVDESLAREPVIFFQAGSHRQVIEMRYKDFVSLVHPVLERFAMGPFNRPNRPMIFPL